MRFPDSRALTQLIERHGWRLYDLTRATEQTITWEEIETTSPVIDLQVGHNYIFVPIPRPGQGLRAAYEAVHRTGPSLRIDDVNASYWLGLKLPSVLHLAVFSRLRVEEGRIYCFTPECGSRAQETDVVVLDWLRALWVFEQYFGIVTHVEWEREVSRAQVTCSGELGRWMAMAPLN